MSPHVMISPSLQCAPLLHLGQAVRILEAAQADMLHIDIMDGGFVPNLALAFDHLTQLKAYTPLPLDIHLMLQNPGQYLPRTLLSTGDRVCFHIENKCDPGPLIVQIRAAGCRAGLAISPSTPVSALQPCLSSLDFVLVMAVQPGFAGQAFIPETLKKIALLHAMAKDQNPKLLISVDGGIDAAWGAQCIAHGADILIAGAKAIFFPDRDLLIETQSFIRKMREAYDDARR